MEPEPKNPDRWLQMGRFTVTAIVTLILVLVFSWGFLTKNIDNQVFTQLVGMVISFWFGAATARTNTPPSPPPAPPNGATPVAPTKETP